MPPEVLIYSLPKYILEERISLKIFNDLHHVIKHNNDLYIVVTGLDIVVRYSLSKKKVLFIYNCFPEVDTWNRFDKKKDYRKINTTKPHFSHPNHVTIYNDKLYITRYKQQDVLVYSLQGKIINNIILNQGIPHDGCIFKIGGLLFITLSWGPSGTKVGTQKLYDELKKFGEILEFARSGRVALSKKKRKTINFIKKLEKTKSNKLNI